MLSISGEYSLNVGPPTSNRVYDQKTVYSFSVVTREGFIVKLLLSTVFGLGSLTLAGLNIWRNWGTV